MKKHTIFAIVSSTLLIFLLAGCINIPGLSKTESDDSKVFIQYRMDKCNEEYKYLLDDENGDLWVMLIENTNSMEITCQFFDQNYIIYTEMNPPYGDYYMTNGSDNKKIYMEYNDDIVNIYFYSNEGDRAEEPFVFKKKYDSRETKN